MLATSDHHHANVVHCCIGTNILPPCFWCLQFVIMVVLKLWIIYKVMTCIALFLVHTCGDYGHVGVVHLYINLDLHCQYPKIHRLAPFVC